MHGEIMGRPFGDEKDERAAPGGHDRHKKW